MFQRGLVWQNSVFAKYFKKNSMETFQIAYLKTFKKKSLN